MLDESSIEDRGPRAILVTTVVDRRGRRAAAGRTQCDAARLRTPPAKMAAPAGLSHGFLPMKPLPAPHS